MTGNAVEIATPKALSEHIRAVQPLLERLLPDARRFGATLMVAARHNREILACSAESVVGAALACAQLELEPGPTGHVWLIPRYSKRTRSKELTVLIGYRGMKALAERHPAVASVRVGTVHAGDRFEWTAAPPRIEHVPAGHGARGVPVCWYAVAYPTDMSQPPWVEVLSPEQVEARRKASQTPDVGPWVTHYDAMARKSCIRALFKQLPSSLDLSRAAAIEDAPDGVVTTAAVTAAAAAGADDLTGGEPDVTVTVEGRLVDEDTGEVLVAAEIPDDAPDGDTSQERATDQQLRALLHLQEDRSIEDAAVLDLVRHRWGIDEPSVLGAFSMLTRADAGALIIEWQPSADDDDERSRDG